MKIKSPDLQFAYGLAKKIGDDIYSKIDSSYSLRKNDERDITTEIEELAEKDAVEAILRKYPTHSIKIEDGESVDNNSLYIWYLDVLDGTKYFTKGVRMFATSIGLWYKGEPFLGVVYNPCTKDCYFAEKGKGAFLNNQRIRVSENHNLEESIADIGLAQLKKSANLKKVKDGLEKTMDHFYKFRILGLGSMSLCFLAQGYSEAFIDLTGKQKMIDLAGGLVIASEAGAKISDIKGEKITNSANGILVTNGSIHNKVLKILN